MTKLSEHEREEHRQRLIDAAWRCVARTGYCDMTVDDVCAEAGVSKGAFYWYFECKDDVLLALLDEDAAASQRVLLTVLRMLHAAVDPPALRWSTLRDGVDVLLAGLGGAA